MLASLQSLRSLRAMRALRTMHAMQRGRVVCNDATTSPSVTGPSSWVIRESSVVTSCRCTGECNDDLVIRGRLNGHLSLQLVKLKLRPKQPLAIIAVEEVFEQGCVGWLHLALLYHEGVVDPDGHGF